MEASEGERRAICFRNRGQPWDRKAASWKKRAADFREEESTKGQEVFGICPTLERNRQEI